MVKKKKSSQPPSSTLSCFHLAAFCSFGEFMAPSKTPNKSDYYQGDWKDGKMHGLGTYRLDRRSHPHHEAEPIARQRWK